MGAQLVFSSILPVIGRETQQEQLIIEVNHWWHWWCHEEQFGFWDHGLGFLDDDLLA